MAPDPVIPCLIGPTASGKTGLGVALARRIGAEVICCDAFSVYRGLSILTAAPEAPADVPHHLVGIRDPAERYSAAAFSADADRLVDEIRARGRRPLVVGGTALYLKGWLKGFGAPVARNPALRDQLQGRAREAGPEAVHAQLAELDPERAKQLHRNDLRRVIRAIEITRATGRPASAQRDDWAGPDRVPARVVCLTRTTEDLDQRIAHRTEALFAAGVRDEVERLDRAALSPEARKALGLETLFALIDGTLDLRAAKAAITQKTRRFARKQRSFFRSFDTASPLPLEPEEPVADILGRLLALLDAPAPAADARPPNEPARPDSPRPDDSSYA